MILPSYDQTFRQQQEPLDVDPVHAKVGPRTAATLCGATGERVFVALNWRVVNCAECRSSAERNGSPW